MKIIMVIVKNAYYFDQNQFSADEMMVPYKRKKKAESLRQYLPNNNWNLWGTGVSGFVYEFLVYTEKSTFVGDAPKITD